MVDNSTQTPRDEDSGKPEEEVTVEEDDAVGSAPDNAEHDDKEGGLLFHYNTSFCSVRGREQTIKAGVHVNLSEI